MTSMPPHSAVRHMEHTCHGEWRTPPTRSDPSNSCSQLPHCPTGTNSALTARERRGRDRKSAAGTSSRRVSSGALQQPELCDGMRCGARGRCGGPLRARRRRSERLTVELHQVVWSVDSWSLTDALWDQLVSPSVSEHKHGSAQALHGGLRNRTLSATMEPDPHLRIVRALQSPHKSPPGQN